MVGKKYPGRVVVSLMAALSLLLVSCPFDFPEKIRLKASPGIYLPLGDPLESQFDLTGPNGLAQLTNLSIPPGGIGTDIYDYQGPEYGETRVVMAVMRDLALYDFTDAANALDLVLAAIPDPAMRPDLTFPAAGDYALPPPSTEDGGIDLSGLFTDIFDEYPGLEFRSIPAYLYVDGPARLFAGGNVRIDFEFYDGATQITSGVPGQVTVSKTALPVLPSPPGPIQTLSPRPQAIDLAGILNQSPDDLTVKVGFTIGTIQVPKNQLASFAAELRTPLAAHLVILLPFQLTATAPIPVFAGPTGGSPPNPAMELISGGKDLLGRSSGTDGAMEDILDNLASLTMQIKLVNNLGINGYIVMLDEMPTDLPAARPPLDPHELGKINLSGKSSVTITKDRLDTVPFSPALEVFLDGDFDIKRSFSGPALSSTIGIILKTDIDTTF
ncbi:MAG: hypothetical protein LBT39_11005 [Treponema sp.]|jgi:hypothetical protein|nr:hypothetical protein [Treponema sp.]